MNDQDAKELADSPDHRGYEDVSYMELRRIVAALTDDITFLAKMLYGASLSCNSVDYERLKKMTER